ncbi:MAG: pathogenicity locus [Anaerolineaceae bacterium]|nr:pathogenicity locus [Anaerolineaceae bacterium]
MNRTSRTRTVFEEIPGVGPNLAQDLLDLGYQGLDELKGQSPEAMFERLCELRNQKIDRCVLYVFRCAVYYAGTPCPDPNKLKWWNWKDG